jgi:hypothetical protein
MKHGVEHGVRRSARLARGSYQVVESRTTSPRRRSARLSPL